MDMLKLHEEALQSTSTAYHEFLLRYKPSKAIVYGFVEGKDDPMFYRGLIEQALPADWEVELIPSGNRDAVLQSMKEFDWDRYSKQRICFFVDRDLTDFVGTKAQECENLYITDGYSIENHAMAFGTFHRMLLEVFGVSNLKPADVERLEAIYSANLSVFREALLPVMAQIIEWRRTGARPTLNDIDIRAFFEFAGGRAKIRPCFAPADSRVTHAAQCVNLSAMPPNDRLVIEEEFKQREGLEKFIRGKYCLWFFIESLTQVHLSIASIVPAYKEPPKVKATIGQKNAMVILGPRVRCPESLRRFLANGFVAFCSLTTCASSAEVEQPPGFFERLVRRLRRLALI